MAFCAYLWRELLLIRKQSLKTLNTVNLVVVDPNDYVLIKQHCAPAYLCTLSLCSLSAICTLITNDGRKKNLSYRLNSKLQLFWKCHRSCLIACGSKWNPIYITGELNNWSIPGMSKYLSPEVTRSFLLCSVFTWIKAVSSPRHLFFL